MLRDVLSCCSATRRRDGVGDAAARPHTVTAPLMLPAAAEDGDAARESARCILSKMINGVPGGAIKPSLNSAALGVF